MVEDGLQSAARPLDALAARQVCRSALYCQFHNTAIPCFRPRPCSLLHPHLSSRHAQLLAASASHAKQRGPCPAARRQRRACQTTCGPVHPRLLSLPPAQYAFGMICALAVGGGVWQFVARYFHNVSATTPSASAAWAELAITL